MIWNLTNERGRVVGGPFDSPHDAIEAQRSCPSVRVHPLHADGYEIDAGFSASDHDHYRLTAA